MSDNWSLIRIREKIYDTEIRNQLASSVFFTFLFLLIAHAARYFDLAYTNDSVQIFQATDAKWQLSIGRWGQVLYCRMRGTIVAPYVIGLLCGFYISFAVFLIIRLLHIKKKRHIAILSMFLTCNESLTSLNATFINSADILMLSMLLSVISVFLWNSFRYGFLVAIPFLTVSISLYQADVQTAIVLILLLIILNVFNGATSKEILFMSVKAILLFGFAITLYLVSLPIIAEHSQIEMSHSYNSPSTIFSETFFSELLIKIINTWKQPFDFMLHPHTLHPVISTVCYCILIIWTTKLIAEELITSKQSLYLKVFVALLLIVFPFGANITHFFSGLIRERMTYSYSVCIIITISLILRKLHKIQDNLYNSIMYSAIPFIVSCVLFYNNMVYGNEYYIRRALEYDTTLSFVTRVTDRIEQTPGYNLNTEVAIIGTLYDSPLAMVRPGFEHLHERDDPNTTNVFAPSAPEKYYWYFWQVLGYPINLVDEYKRYSLSLLKNVRTMPVFPQDGCIQFVDDVLVVKLGYVYIPPEFE